MQREVHDAGLQRTAEDCRKVKYGWSLLVAAQDERLGDPGKKVRMRMAGGSPAPYTQGREKPPKVASTTLARE